MAKTFEIEFQRISYIIVNVVANDAEEAKELAMEQIWEEYGEDGSMYSIVGPDQFTEDF